MEHNYPENPSDSEEEAEYYNKLQNLDNETLMKIEIEFKK
jgi:hypothetical protein